ncbi:MAG: hypothetical protein AB1690_05510 [Candidatus Zixiibacteriota bacterium]
MFGLKEISFDILTGHPLVTGLFFALFILFAVYLYRRTNPPLPGKLRILLSALRIVAILALFLALFEPVLSYKREYERQPRLTLLLDKSNSMEIVESGKSRAERVDSLLASGGLKQLLGRFDIRERYFSHGLFGDRSDINREKTALGDALQQAAQAELGEPSEYWLLLSDGISNSGISPLDAAVSVKTPIIAVGAGQQRAEKDVAITGVDYNQVVFAGKPTEMTVRLEWSGMKNDRASLQVKSGERILKGETTNLAEGNLRQELKISFVPERPGQQTFEIEIPSLPDEEFLGNNSRTISMTVLKSRLKVLLAADYLDWEYSFLNRYLKNSSSVELFTSVPKAGGQYIGIPFPSRQEELNQYDLLILYDINLESLKSRAPLVESFLADRGGGLMVFLGENYLRSPYPRWLDQFLPFVSRSRRDKPVFMRFNGVPVENYLFHPTVRIAESGAAIRDGWRNLPPFQVLVSTDSIAPGAEVLVTAGAGPGGRDMPILGYRTVGAGKVLATNAAPFWQWSFFSYGFGGNGEEYQKFFGGVVNWLSLKEETDPIQIKPDKNVYTKGEPVGFTGAVFDLGFRPISGATGHISLIDELNGDTAVAPLVEKGDGYYRADFGALSSGRYRYAGIISKDNKTLKESGGEIAVEKFSIEENHRNPDFSTLAAVARMTGGDFFPMGEADKLAERLKAESIAVSQQKEIVLWNKFWLLGIFIAALAGEWFLRKRYELI